MLLEKQDLRAQSLPPGDSDWLGGRGRGSGKAGDERRLGAYRFELDGTAAARHIAWADAEDTREAAAIHSKPCTKKNGMGGCSGSALLAMPPR